MAICIFNPIFLLLESRKFYTIIIKINVMKVKYMTNKTEFKLFQWDPMIYIYSIPSQFLLPSPLKPKYITSPNETLKGL